MPGCLNIMSIARAASCHVRQRRTPRNQYVASCDIDIDISTEAWRCVRGKVGPTDDATNHDVSAKQRCKTARVKIAPHSNMPRSYQLNTPGGSCHKFRFPKVDFDDCESDSVTATRQDEIRGITIQLCETSNLARSTSVSSKSKLRSVANEFAECGHDSPRPPDLDFVPLIKHPSNLPPLPTDFDSKHSSQNRTSFRDVYPQLTSGKQIPRKAWASPRLSNVCKSAVGSDKHSGYASIHSIRLGASPPAGPSRSRRIAASPRRVRVANASDVNSSPETRHDEYEGCPTRLEASPRYASSCESRTSDSPRSAQTELTSECDGNSEVDSRYSPQSGPSPRPSNTPNAAQASTGSDEPSEDAPSDSKRKRSQQLPQSMPCSAKPFEHKVGAVAHPEDVPSRTSSSHSTSTCCSSSDQHDIHGIINSRNQNVVVPDVPTTIR